MLEHLEDRLAPVARTFQLIWDGPENPGGAANWSIAKNWQDRATGMRVVLQPGDTLNYAASTFTFNDTYNGPSTADVATIGTLKVDAGYTKPITLTTALTVLQGGEYNAPNATITGKKLTFSGGSFLWRQGIMSATGPGGDTATVVGPKGKLILNGSSLLANNSPLLVNRSLIIQQPTPIPTATTDPGTMQVQLYSGFFGMVGTANVQNYGGFGVGPQAAGIVAAVQTAAQTVNKPAIYSWYPFTTATSVPTPAFTNNKGAVFSVLGGTPMAQTIPIAVGFNNYGTVVLGPANVASSGTASLNFQAGGVNGGAVVLNKGSQVWYTVPGSATGLYRPWYYWQGGTQFTGSGVVVVYGNDASSYARLTITNNTTVAFSKTVTFKASGAVLYGPGTIDLQSGTHYCYGTWLGFGTSAGPTLKVDRA